MQKARQSWHTELSTSLIKLDLGRYIYEMHSILTYKLYLARVKQVGEGEAQVYNPRTKLIF